MISQRKANNGIRPCVSRFPLSNKAEILKTYKNPPTQEGEPESVNTKKIPPKNEGSNRSRSKTHRFQDKHRRPFTDLTRSKRMDYLCGLRAPPCVLRKEEEEQLRGAEPDHHDQQQRNIANRRERQRSRIQRDRRAHQRKNPAQIARSTGGKNRSEGEEGGIGLGEERGVGCT